MKRLGSQGVVARGALMIVIATLALIFGPGVPPAAADHYGNGSYPYYYNLYGDSYGADCNTQRDTPPAYHLTSGAVCYGSLTNEYNDVDCAATRCDEFTVDAGVDDAVLVGFGSQCRTNYWYPFRPSDTGPFWREDGTMGDGFFTAREGGRHRLIVQTGLDYNSDGYHVCSRGSYGGAIYSPYTLRVDVVPNTRPVVNVTSGPTRVLVGEAASFALAATDVDNNLKSLHASAASTGTEGTTASSVGNAVAVRLHAAQDVRLWARDAWGVESDPILRPVEVYEDDCGTGADIAVRALALDEACTAYLAGSLGDNSDTFTVDVPAGVARLRVDFALTPLLSATVKATSPSGVVTTNISDMSILTSEAGTWTMEVIRSTPCCIDLSAGGYTLRIAPIGAAAPPALTSSFAPSTLIAGEVTTLQGLATDPNGLDLRYNVSWGDGTTAEVPTTGMVDSGTPLSLNKAYTSPGERTVRITATNVEGLVSTADYAVAVTWGADACAGGSTSKVDAPATSAGWSTADTAAYQRTSPATCTGWLRGIVPTTGTGTAYDYGDVVKLRQSVISGAALDVTMRAAANGYSFRVMSTTRNALVATTGGEWRAVAPNRSVTLRVLVPLDVENVVVEVSHATRPTTWSLTAVPAALA